MHADDPGAKAWAGNRICHHLAVILLPDPPLGGVGRRAQKGAQAVNRINIRHKLKWFGCVSGNPGPVIFRGGSCEGRQGQIGFFFPIVEDHKTILRDGFTHHGKIEVPFLENGPGRGFFCRVQHHQHTLLAF